MNSPRCSNCHRKKIESGDDCAEVVVAVLFQR